MAKTQTRRSISVRGELYERIHKYCEANSISMSSFVENRISSFLNGSVMDEQPPLPYGDDEPNLIVPSAPNSPVAVQAATTPARPSLSNAELSAEIQQHFTF